MVFHQDSASYYTLIQTIQNLDDVDINYVAPVEWRPKSPDTADVTDVTIHLPIYYPYLSLCKYAHYIWNQYFSSFCIPIHNVHFQIHQIRVVQLIYRSLLITYDYGNIKINKARHAKRQQIRYDRDCAEKRTEFHRCRNQYKIYKCDENLIAHKNRQ